VSKFSHIVVNEKRFDNHRQLPHPSDITTVAECLVGLAKELKLSKVEQYHTVVQVALLVHLGKLKKNIKKKVSNMIIKTVVPSRVSDFSLSDYGTLVT